MKYVYVDVLKRVIPRLFLLLIFVDFPGYHAAAQEQLNTTQSAQEKLIKKDKRQPVNAPNETLLAQVVGRITKLQEMVIQSGVSNPTEKMRLTMSSMCPDIQLSETGWPIIADLRKTIASHFDQGELYLDLLLNLHQDINSEK
jgi:hypothetical protein